VSIFFPVLDDRRFVGAGTGDAFGGKGPVKLAQRPGERIDNGVLPCLIPGILFRFYRASFNTSPFISKDSMLHRNAGGQPVLLLSAN
jgi:hypothetical protein